MTTLAVPPPAKVERSEKEILTGLQQTVSASRLTLFLQCRLKFYYRYVLKLTKPKPASLHVGNVVHATLKAWHKARWMEAPLTLKGLHDEFSKAWHLQNKEEPVDWQGDEEDEKLTAWRLCELYLHQSGFENAQKPDAVEVPVEADLVIHGLPRLIGILDLVQQRKIIDYKTSSTTPNSEKVAHTHEVQTSIYAILYRDSTETREEGVELHHLVKLKNPKLCVTALPPMSDGQETRLFHLLEAYLEGIARQDFIPSPGMTCASCEFFNECRRWK